MICSMGTGPVKIPIESLRQHKLEFKVDDSAV
jgi:hypothetical protein